jgi:murein DD-endopeptidase MepM/ murein hydrolase activator NlpD
MRRSHLLFPVVAATFALWAVLPVGSEGASTARLQQKIDETEKKIGRKKGTEKVLSTQVAAVSTKIDRLESRIDVLRGRQATVQADLDDATAELEEIQRELRHQRARLVRLKARLSQARTVLAHRLVERYQADKPDLLGVVLNSHGFADLLERTEFLRRIGKQDNRVIQNVKTARADATITEARLAKLRVGAQALTDRIQARRDEIAAVKGGLLDTQGGYRDTKDEKATLLASVRGDRHDLEEDLSAMHDQQAKIEATLTGVPSGPARQGSGSMVWPVNGPLTSPFCESRSWENCHPGIDIAVPTGTQIRAADAGRVALAAWTGGYGNYTCIQHSASLSTCYGHQSAYRVSAGQDVAKGQVIGLSGSTGFSTGPHLHFEVRVNGGVVSPMDYL